jgi:hypothetical protein
MNLRGNSTHLVLGMTIREHIGGRWAIPWAAVILTFPLNILATVSANVSPDGEGTSLQWVVASLAGVAAMVAVFLVAQLTVLRRAKERPVPVWVIGAIGAFAAALRVPVMDVALNAMGLSTLTTVAFVTRIIPSAALGFLLLPLGAFVTSVIHEFRSQRRTLVRDEIALLQAQMRAEGATQVLRQALVDQVESDLASAIDEYHNNTSSVEETLQRTGRELWAPTATRSQVQFRWRQVVIAGLRRNPLPVGLVLLIWIPTALMAFVTYLDWWATFVRASLSALAIFGVFSIGRWWIRRRGHSSFAVLVLVLTGSWLLTSPLPWLVLLDRPWDIALATMIANAVWLTFITVLSGIAVLALSSSEDILRELRKNVSDAEIQALAADEELADLRRELAAQLHGPVRSRINTATAIVRGTLGAQSSQVESELHAALRSLSEVTGSSRSEGDVLDAVVRALDPWQPLIDITVTCPSVTVSDSSTIAIVAEEAVANAYRHGSAEQVHVNISVDMDEIHMTVEDDGSGLSSHLEPGLGSRLLDHHAPGCWSRSAVPTGGVLLQVTFKAALLGT